MRTLRPFGVGALAGVLVLALAAGCGGSSTAAPRPSPSPAAAAVYVSPAGFRLALPATWMRGNVRGLDVVAYLPDSLPGTFKDNVGVLVEKTGDASLTIASYQSQSLALAPKQLQRFHLVSRTSQVRDGVAQGLLDYTGSTGGLALHFLALTEVKAGVAYTATFTSLPETYPAHLPAVRPVLESLRPS